MTGIAILSFENTNVFFSCAHNKCAVICFKMLNKPKIPLATRVLVQQERMQIMNEMPHGEKIITALVSSKKVIVNAMIINTETVSKMIKNEVMASLTMSMVMVKKDIINTMIVSSLKV